MPSSHPVMCVFMRDVGSIGFLAFTQCVFSLCNGRGSPDFVIRDL